jgi:hypothetical protein
VGKTTDKFANSFKGYSTEATDLIERWETLTKQYREIREAFKEAEEKLNFKELAEVEKKKNKALDDKGELRKAFLALQSELYKETTKFKAYIEKKEEGKGLFAFQSKKSLGAAKELLDQADVVYAKLCLVSKKIKT